MPTPTSPRPQPSPAGRCLPALLVAGASLALLVASQAVALAVPPLPSGQLYVLGVAACALVGGLVAYRKADNPIGWILLATAAVFAVEEAFVHSARLVQLQRPDATWLIGLLAWPEAWIWIPGIAALLFYLPLHFPDGRLISPHWRPVRRAGTLLVALMLPVFMVVPDSLSVAGAIPNPLGLELGPRWEALPGGLSAALFAFALVAVASLVVRYRRAPPLVRQQLKWLLLIATVSPLAILLRNALEALGAPLLLTRALDGLGLLTFCALPLTIGLAVLKYRLYDVDLVIHRTLVYSLLTGSLAACYFGVTVIFQALLRALSGAESDLAVVASTLAVAGLFAPLRRRLQSFIDRIYYRRGYDPQRVLARFGATANREVDLDSLAGALSSVVGGTMEPAHLSVWLRPHGPEAAAGTAAETARRLEASK